MPGNSKGSTSEFASAVHKKDTDDDCPVRVYHESQVPSASSLESGQREDADTGQNGLRGKRRDRLTHLTARMGV